MSPETRQPKEAEIEQLTHELASLETKRRTLQAEIETVSGEMEKISVRLEQLRQGSDIGQAVEEADTKKETASKHELFPGFE
jgi:predicted nuclease with TOPRIM domain